MSTEATISHARGAWKKPFNAHRIEGDVAYLLLTNNRGEPKAEVQIDAADLPALIEAGHRWCRTPYGYAFRLSEGKGLYLHRHLLGAPADMQVDHINRDRLDCRRSNLRVVTQQQNLQNRGLDGIGSTGVRGVTKYKSAKFPFKVRVGFKPTVFALKVRTLNIGRITASLARAQHWGAEAA